MPNEAFNIFHQHLLLFHALCFPRVKVKIKSNSKLIWITKGMKIASKTKRYLFLRYAYSKSKVIKREIKLYHKNYTRILKRCIRQAQKNNNKKLVSKSGNIVATTWNIIKDNLGQNQLNHNMDKITFKGKVTTNPQKIANEFNKQFLEIPSLVTSDGCSASCKRANFNSSSIYLKPTDPLELLKIISSLRNSKSSGYDDLNTKTIKDNAKAVVEPLTHIINLSILEGRFPDGLKTSVIKPIFKKGDKSNSQSYRPIALIPIISKIFERVIYVQMVNFFDKFETLTECQFGFRKNISTTLATLHLLREISYSRDKKIPITGIFMDMSKAFDCVNHTILMHKLYDSGIRGNAYDWVKSYLLDRKQRTEITKYCGQSRSMKKFKSSLDTVGQGVPQGSILGPLLR